MASEAVKGFREIPSQSGEASALGTLGTVLWYQGDLAQAGKCLLAAITIDQHTEDKTQLGSDLSALGDVLMDQGNLAEARQRYQEAWSLGSAQGEKATAAESRLQLAELAIEEGRPEEAVGPLRDAIQEFHQEKLRVDETTAHVLLARVFLAQAKPQSPENGISPARKEIIEAESVAGECQNRPVCLGLEIESARVQAATGRHVEIAKAVSKLRRALAEARQLVFWKRQFEARLAITQIEEKQAYVGGTRSDLQKLAADAESKGFHLIAQKAAQRLAPN